MRFDNGRQSDNVEDRRGARGGRSGLRMGRGKIGVGTIVLALVAMYFGVDPSVVLNTGLGECKNALEHDVFGAAFFRARHDVVVEEVTTAREDMEFKLPAELRAWSNSDQM